MLKRLIPLLALILLFSPPALAGFEEGKTAYDHKDWVKAITELRPAAEGGDDRAMILLGNMYANGYGVIRSYQEALSLYKRAAVENNIDGMVAVGGIYVAGLGVPQNMTVAKQWFERAAMMGSQQAALFLGTILFQGNKSEGDEIKPDVYSAYKWFRIASTEKQMPQSLDKIKIVADKLAKEKLTPEEAAKADKEIAGWKPVDPFKLGAFPADPAPSLATPTGTPPKKPEAAPQEKKKP